MGQRSVVWYLVAASGHGRKFRRPLFLNWQSILRWTNGQPREFSPERAEGAGTIHARRRTLCMRVFNRVQLTHDALDIYLNCAASILRRALRM